MNACAAGTQIASPARRSSATLPEYLAAKGNEPRLTGRNRPSLHPIQSASRQKPLSEPGPQTSLHVPNSLCVSCRPAFSLLHPLLPSTPSGHRSVYRVSATPPAPLFSGCCRCSPLRCIRSALVSPPSASTSSKAALPPIA